MFRFSSLATYLYRPSVVFCLFVLTLSACDSPVQGTQVQESDTNQSGETQVSESSKPEGELASATFGGGCFWCVEAVFEEMNGVNEVISGYEGGKSKAPTYDEVCSGRTGHAEVCLVKYDPEVVSFEKLLQVFFTTHDPTTLNRQGNDIGTQYRSAIFYHDEEQKKTAEEIIAKLDEAKAFKDKIVTEVVPTTKFYVAEDYHQDYFANNPGNRYCAYVIPPKLAKLKKVFGEDLKEKAKKEK